MYKSSRKRQTRASATNIRQLLGLSESVLEGEWGQTWILSCEIHGHYHNVTHGLLSLNWRKLWVHKCNFFAGLHQSSKSFFLFLKSSFGCLFSPKTDFLGKISFIFSASLAFSFHMIVCMSISKTLHPQPYCQIYFKMHIDFVWKLLLVAKHTFR